MKTATLDLLDAELADGFDKYMKMPLQQHHKLYRQDLVISPRYWDQHFPMISQQSFNWVTVRYTDLDAHLKTVNSNQTGIYYFSVRPDFLLGDVPHFVFYVGVAGERGSCRPLRTRLRDYLRIEAIKKRVKVHRTLEQYYPKVWVTYSFLSLGDKALSDLEKAFHGFFIPWANERDFPIEIKKARRAWG